MINKINFFLLKAKCPVFIHFLDLDRGILNLIYLNIRGKSQNIHFLKFFFLGKIDKKFSSHFQLCRFWPLRECLGLEVLSSAVNSSFSLEICCKHKTLLSFFFFFFLRYLELAEHQFLSDRYFGSLSRLLDLAVIDTWVNQNFSTIQIWILNFHAIP